MNKEELKKKYKEQLDIVHHYEDKMRKAKEEYDKQYRLYLRAKIHLNFVEEELYGPSTIDI